MKIQILPATEASIGGYERVDIGENSIDLSKFSDNECEFILANDLMDFFPLQNFSAIVKYVASKLRLGGQLVIGGTDVRLFCMSVINNALTQEDASNLIFSKKSMSSPAQLVKILTELGIKVQSSQINGIHYELTGTR